jgi:diguanylate cyclase (GGDEF)-like protein
VVTFYDAFVDPRHAALFVHDQTGSIFMALPSRPVLALKPGTRVDVEAVTGTGDYAPVLLRPKVTILGAGALPKNAARPTMGELLSGSQDGQWIEVEGIVRGVRREPRNVILDITTAEGPFAATGPLEAGVDYETFVDALVRIRGNAVPVFNGSGQMVGARLLFPSTSVLKIVQQPPGDPYSGPAVPVVHLLQFSPGVVLRHRSHIRGMVTLYWPGRLLCIQDPTRGLCVQTQKADAVGIGEVVDVVGFPAIEDLRPTLADASFRPAGGSETPVPTPLTIQQAVQLYHDQELVEIEGEIIGQDRAAGDLLLELRSGDFLYSAVLPKGSFDPEQRPWKDGSEVRVRGVCGLQMNLSTSGRGSGAVQPASVSVLLRTTDDVMVLHAPSWWTAGRTLAVLAVVVALALAGFAWVVVLRHRVEQQTRTIRESEERLRHLSQHDALTGLPNRLLLEDRLNVALKRSARFNSVLGILMVDLDGFKAVNDTLGHRAGDLALCEIASRIRKSVRQTDTVARLGGDEFIVLLPDLRLSEEAEAMASKIAALIAEPFQADGKPIAISASIGVCVSPRDSTDAEELMQQVDAAMYRAKALGRNRWEVHR